MLTLIIILIIIAAIFQRYGLLATLLAELPLLGAALSLPKWLDILATIDTNELHQRTHLNYQERLKHSVDIAHSHLKHCLNRLEREGYIERSWKRGKRFIRLTPAGKQLAETIHSLKAAVKKHGPILFEVRD